MISTMQCRIIKIFSTGMAGLVSHPLYSLELALFLPCLIFLLTLISLTLKLPVKCQYISFSLCLYSYPLPSLPPLYRLIRTWTSLSLVVTGVMPLIAGSWESLVKAGVARAGDGLRIWNSSYLLSRTEVGYFDFIAIDVAMLRYIS